MKTQKKSGISLIVLVITIIVIVVLSLAVILTIAQNNPIENARKAVFLNNFKQMQEEVNMYIATEYANNLGKSSLPTILDEEELAQFESMKDYTDKVIVMNGVVQYVGNDATEKQWLQESGVAENEKWEDYADTAWYDKDTEAEEFYISTAEELAGLAKIVNDEIDNFVGKRIYIQNDINLQGKEWTPIASEGAVFYGYFYGNNHTISELKIDSSTVSGGLFGNLVAEYEMTNNVISLITGNAAIYDLTIKDSYISTPYAGAFCNYMELGTINNCHSIDNVIISNSNTSYGGAGGIASDICYATYVEKCSNTSKVVSVGKSKYGAGGIVGWGSDGVTPDGIDMSRIDQCYNSGEIISSKDAGGICGFLSGVQIAYCYNTGKVTGKLTSGGIMGYMQDSVVSICYNVGDIQLEDSTIGIKGELVGNAFYGEINNSYYLENRVGVGKIYTQESPDYVEGDDYMKITNVASKSDADMKAADFVGLLRNFKQNPNGGYPILSWQ